MLEEIYCDGCFNAKTGKHAWASCTDKTGKDLMKDFSKLSFLSDFTFEQVKAPKGDYFVCKTHFEGVQQQNNGAELVALLIALRVANSQLSSVLSNKPKPFIRIYSDSELLVKYWSNPKHKQKNFNFDPSKLKFIQECKNLRKSCGDKIEVLFVPGDSNPADLGFHKQSEKRKLISDSNSNPSKRTLTNSCKKE